jgi:HSP20 family molecular chaperone IbpA
MSLLPFHPDPFFDDLFDPFLFYPIHLYDPWFDVPLVPPAPVIRKSFRWVKRQERVVYHSTNTTNTVTNIPVKLSPPPLERFRVQLDVTGFTPESIRTRIEGQRIIVEAKQEDRQAFGDFNLRELRKSYELPGPADANQLISHLGSNNMLFIEVPIKNPESERRLDVVKRQSQSLVGFGNQSDPFNDNAELFGGPDLLPRIVDKGFSGKQVQLTIDMKNYRPDEIKVSVKHNILVVRGEHRYNDGNRYERAYFFKTATLPRGTQVDQLKSTFSDDGQLKIEAPFYDAITF